MIRRSGENIAAVEVEAVLGKHPLIRQAAVAVTPDTLRGDEVAALIVTDDPDAGQQTAEEIVRWSLEQMAYYKAPGWIAFVTELPRTPTEKILRAALKALVDEKMSRGEFFDMRAMKKRQM